MGKLDIFKVSVPIVAKFRALKMDAKSDVEKRCEKMSKKLLWARILVLLAAFWTAWGAPGASQERPKSVPRALPRGPKSPQDGLFKDLGLHF